MNSPIKNKILLTLIPLLALGLAAPAIASETSAKIEANIAEVKGDTAKLALKELRSEERL